MSLTTDLLTIKNILSRHYSLDKNKTFIFGSRAKGSYRKNSDLDILIEDTDIDGALVSKLYEAFEESNLLYKVDIILRSRVDESFYQNIKQDLKRIS